MNGFQNLKKDLKLTKQKSLAAWTDREYDEIMQSMDRDKDGVISYGEFIAAAIDKVELLSLENIKRTFKVIDEDGSGYISLDELKNAFTQKGSKSEEQRGSKGGDVWKDIMRKADLDKDGKISEKEFIQAMKEVLHSKVA